MVVAIGARGVRLAPADALAVVWGYAVGLDMTRRDLQNEMREKKRPWDIGKSFAEAAPIGAVASGVQRSGIRAAARSGSTSTASAGSRAISPT